MQAFLPKAWPMSVRRWRRAALVAAASVLATGALSRPSLASDHDDSPSLTTDPGVDIADLYAFMKPGSGTHLVLGMTVHPGATAASAFDTGVEYVFQVLGYDPAAGVLDPTLASATIACRFQPPQASETLVVCSANGTSAFATVGVVDSTPGDRPLRIFAGLRADPAFGDLTALGTTLSTGQLAFAANGANTFAGKNVLAIVVEVDVDAVLLPGHPSGEPRPLFGVVATTERL